MSLHRQTGWYNGALMFGVLFGLILFVAQPWIPLVLLFGAGLAGLAIMASKGADRWHEHQHHNHPPPPAV